MKFVAEKYFAILLDRTTSGPLIIACSEGGTSIEDLAEKYPEKILKMPIDIRSGITDKQVRTPSRVEATPLLTLLILSACMHLWFAQRCRDGVTRQLPCIRAASRQGRAHARLFSSSSQSC